jgi:hypothetical protein
MARLAVPVSGSTVWTTNNGYQKEASEATLGGRLVETLFSSGSSAARSPERTAPLPEEVGWSAQAPTDNRPIPGSQGKAYTWCDPRTIPITKDGDKSRAQGAGRRAQGGTLPIGRSTGRWLGWRAGGLIMGRGSGRGRGPDSGRGPGVGGVCPRCGRGSGRVPGCGWGSGRGRALIVGGAWCWAGLRSRAWPWPGPGCGAPGLQ